MFKVGDFVRWRCPLDADYSYGTIVALERTVATVVGTDYYAGVTTHIFLRYIERVEKGGKGVECDSTKHNKLSSP